MDLWSKSSGLARCFFVKLARLLGLSRTKGVTKSWVSYFDPPESVEQQQKPQTMGSKREAKIHG